MSIEIGDGGLGYIYLGDILIAGGGGGGGGGYKSYTQLKAMTLANAITELNTDPQGYYDNLNGNGHIIGIGIANDDKTTYQCWDVSPIIYWNGSWRNGEIIICVMKADSNGDLKIPVAGYGNGGGQGTSYNWWVSIDGGSETTYSGTGSKTPITIATGLTANSEHTVTIKPTTEAYGWARAFGFRFSGIQSLLTEIVYDGSYMGYATSATSTGDYFRYYQYNLCTYLKASPDEVMPNTVTQIGTYFRGRQFDGCTSLKTAGAEALSSSTSSIGSYFRAFQYISCNVLTEIKGWKDLSIGGSYYRNQQYYSIGSATVKVLSDVGYPAYNGNTLTDSSVTQVQVPSAYLTNFKNATTLPRSGITDSKFIGY